MAHPVMDVPAEVMSPTKRIEAKDRETLVSFPAFPAEKPSYPIIPGYIIEQMLGVGSVGVVYKAVDLLLGRTVAIKMLSPRHQNNKRIRDQFQKEAELVAKLNHESIVHVYSSNMLDDQPYTVLEYCSSGTLAGYLRGKRLPAKVTAQLMLTLALALEHAHNRGIFHRDFKPNNVLLVPRRPVSSFIVLQSSVDHPLITNFNAKIADLGLGVDITKSMLDANEVIGTASYMAPEQADATASKDGVLVDIYALGATMYECLSGRPPHQGKTVYETLTQLRSHEPVPLKAFCKKIPADMDAVCMKCLARDPKQRYATMSELANDLNAFLCNKPVSCRAPSTWDKLKSVIKRYRVTLTVVATAIITFLLTTIILQLVRLH